MSYKEIDGNWDVDTVEAINEGLKKSANLETEMKVKVDKSIDSALVTLSDSQKELMSKFKTGRNLFDKGGNIFTNTTISSSGNLYQPNDNMSATGYRIPLKPNTTYQGTTLFWFVVFDRYGSIEQAGSAVKTFKTSADSDSVVIAIRPAAVSTFMIAEGETTLTTADYEPYSVMIEDMTVEEVKRARETINGREYPTLNGRLVNMEAEKEDIKIGSNLINRDGLLLNTQINANGEYEASEERSSTRLIKVKPNTIYRSTGRLIYTLFDADLNPTRHGSHGAATNFNTGSNDVYVVLSPRLEHIARIMFVETETPLNADIDYIPFEVTRDGREPLNMTDPQVEAMFINKMNEKAHDLGLSDTTYTNSSGLRAGGDGQLSTVKDTLTMLLHATKYKDLISVWGKDSYRVKVKGANARDLDISTTVSNSDLEADYKLLGGKSGSIFEPTEYHVATVTADNDGNVFASVVFAAAASAERFTATKQLLNNASKGIELTEAEFLGKAGAIVKLKNHQSLYDPNDHDYSISFNENVQYRPASTIKIMTALIMLDVVRNLNEVFEIRRTDIVGGSGPSFQAGDIISFKDALYLLMLPSSNNTAKAIARVVGRKIAESQHA